MARWLGDYAERVDALAWRPDLWGRRMLFWTAHAPLILSSTDLVYRRACSTRWRAARGISTAVPTRRPPARRASPPGAASSRRGCSFPRRSAPQLRRGGAARALASGLSEDGGSVSRSRRCCSTRSCCWRCCANLCGAARGDAGGRHRGADPRGAGAARRDARRRHGGELAGRRTGDPRCARRGDRRERRADTAAAPGARLGLSAARRRWRGADRRGRAAAGRTAGRGRLRLDAGVSNSPTARRG